jgi:two-component system response regulator MprA
MPARILVVEDDYLIREVLNTALSDEGYTVDVAEDGMSAVDYLAERRPDLVVLDLALPRVDGLRVCEIVREQPSTSDVPVLVVSAMASASVVQAAYRAGANAYLDKPFDLSDFLSNVQSLLHADERSLAS